MAGYGRRAAAGVRAQIEDLEEGPTRLPRRDKTPDSNPQGARIGVGGSGRLKTAFSRQVSAVSILPGSVSRHQDEDWAYFASIDSADAHRKNLLLKRNLFPPLKGKVNPATQRFSILVWQGLNCQKR